MLLVETDKQMIRAHQVFESVLTWLLEHYGSYRFYKERDIVWTLQLCLADIIAQQGLPFRVYDDYPIIPGKRRSLSADLALVDIDQTVLVAAELKYEPAHTRTDILGTKFPVVFWGEQGVAKDVERARQFAEQHKVQYAYALFIDEGSHFRHREPHPGSLWKDWGQPANTTYNISILWTRVP